MKIKITILIFLTLLSAIVTALPAEASPMMPARQHNTAKNKAKAKSKAKPRATTRTREASAVRQERSQTQRDITETRRRLDNNTRQTRQNLDRLNTLDAQIQRQQTSITALQNQVNALADSIALQADTITRLQAHIDTLRADLAANLRHIRTRRQRLNPMLLLFSATDFNDAAKRMGHLARLRSREAARITRLKDKVAELDRRRATLANLRDNQATALGKLAVARDVLVGQHNESERLDRDLRRQGADLQRILQEKQRRIRQLDAELDRIIAEEARRAQARTRPSAPQPGQQRPTPEQGTAIPGTAQTSRQLSGPFVSNKGRLLFPVAGDYTITGTFGRGQRAGLAIDNSGIDISVKPGTAARAVFDGTVTSIFVMPTYRNVVIVRHGAYLTVYAGLSSVNVAKGHKVKTGQTIGTIATDATTGRTELHFEVRHERQKLNPLQWVR